MVLRENTTWGATVQLCARHESVSTCFDLGCAQDVVYEKLETSHKVIGEACKWIVCELEEQKAY